MKKTRLCDLLGIEYPVIQAAMPWISNPELAAAVSEAGGMGVVTPTATMAPDGNPVQNLRAVIQRVRNLTAHPFGTGLYLGHPEIEELVRVIIDEGARVAITYGGSPALFTSRLKDAEIRVLHVVATVRHARSAEAQGVDAVITEGVESGGVQGWDELPTIVLTPQVRDAVEVPVVAGGGVADGRGLLAVLALGADGAYVGTRFAATRECAAHQRYKEAIVSAVDTGTVVVARTHRPMRVLKGECAQRLRNSSLGSDPHHLTAAEWEGALSTRNIRAGALEGRLNEGLAWCGASAGLVSDIVGAAEVMKALVKGADEALHQLTSGWQRE
ncbi:MAG: nitronate monooxygenase [Chloroflexi bacterium]|nr:nitronate monooxygenase [Chloroflexota bacterium]